MNKIKSYDQALKYLYKYIPLGNEYKFPGNFGLKRTKYILKQLDNPQNKVKIIHVAGTSGKGSTSFFLSEIIRALGFNVGLSLSPHLLDIRERFQVNNELISETMFCEYLNEIQLVIDRAKKTKFGSPTYFEITVVLAYYIFAKLNLDYAVIETGLGGLYDGTNVVDRPDKLAVITKIGRDHTKILGKTLDKIAYQKAGIIQSGNTVLTINQNNRVLDVIKKEASRKKAKTFVIDTSNSRIITLVPQPKFDFKFLNTSFNNISLKMIGSFQVQNFSLALSAVILLSRKDRFPIDIEKVKESLTNVLFYGRMQRMEIKGHNVIIDGAHNPQKMSMFIKNLIRYYPYQKFVFLIAFKRGKDYKDILRYVVPFANKIIVTSFFNQTKSQGMVTIAEDMNVIAQTLKDLSFNNFVLCEDNKKAVLKLLSSKSMVKIVTGSLYLLSDVYPILNDLIISQPTQRQTCITGSSR